jgi:Ca-activated chloride channel family protein
MSLPIQVRFRQAVCPSAGGIIHALITVVAPPAEVMVVRPPVDIAMVLDRSGSMAGERMVMAQRAIVDAARMLSLSDRLSIVTFDDQIEVVLPLQAAGGALVPEVERIVAGIVARGQTNLSGGWQAGCAQLAVDADKNRIKTCILLTDGVANVGIVDGQELSRHAQVIRGHGIRTTAFGLGDKFAESLLGGMSDAGGGAFQSIDHVGKLAAALAAEVQESLTVTARGVEVALRFPEAGCMRSCRVIGDVWALQSGSDGPRVALHDLVQLQFVEFAVEMDLAPGILGSRFMLEVSVGSADGAFAGSASADLLRATSEQVMTSRPDATVEPLIGRMEAAAVVRRVSALVARGDHQDAQGIAQAFLAAGFATAGRLQDADYLAVVRQAEVSLKDVLSRDQVRATAAYYRSSNILRSRETDGQTRSFPMPPPQ